MTRVVPLILAVCLATIRAAAADDWLDLRVAGQHAAARGYGFDLGEPDDAAAPHVWLGPMVITSPSGRSCRVSEDVEIIDRPLELLRGRLLYVDTYSGSEDRVFVVDVTTCAIVWTSPVYDGPSRIRGDRLLLYGLAPFRIGARGLPAPERSARAVPPLGSDADADLAVERAPVSGLRVSPATAPGAWRDLRVAGHAAAAGGTTVDLRYADDRRRPPQAWSGPIVITAPDGTSCEVDDAVEDIERPLEMLGGRLLYVATHAHGHARMFVVDTADCAVAWASPAYHGAAHIRGDTLLLGGSAPFRIGSDGLPARGTAGPTRSRP